MTQLNILFYWNQALNRNYQPKEQQIYMYFLLFLWKRNNIKNEIQITTVCFTYMLRILVSKPAIYTQGVHQDNIEY